MGNPDDEDVPEWITRVRAGGSIPLLEPNKCSNGWSSPPGNIFTLRGPNYFADKSKIPGGDYLLTPLGFDWIKGPTKISEVLKNPQNRVRKAIDDEFPNGDKPFVWAFNFQLPSKDNNSIIAYFVANEPILEGSLLDKFLKEGDKYRDSRLKLIANVPKGPWIVKKAVGDNVVCLIGKALTCRYCVAKNFIEVDIDVCSSMVATAVVHLAFDYIANITFDVAFMIESQTENELPERILGAIRFGDLDAASAGTTVVDVSSDGVVAGDSQSSLSTRIWKSLGRGFSNVVHPGGRQSSQVSSSSCAKQGIDEEKNGKLIKK